MATIGPSGGGTLIGQGVSGPASLLSSGFPNGLSIPTSSGGSGGPALGCSVAGNSTALSNAAYVSLAFNSADLFDTTNYHDPAVNNTRLTIPSGLGGKYLFIVQSTWPNNTTNSTDKRLTYRINAGADPGSPSYRSLNGDGIGILGVGSFAVIVILNSGDFIEARQWNNVASQTTASYTAQLILLDSSVSNSGTVFPSGPAVGNQFYRTDRNLLYYWDGTRWLTTNLYTMDIPSYNDANVQPYGGTPSLTHRQVAMTDLYDMWVVDFRGTLRVAATNNTTNFWTTTLSIFGAATFNMASFDTHLDTAATITRHTAAVNALAGTTNILFQVTSVKTGTPGNGDANTFQITYRLVG